MKLAICNLCLKESKLIKSHIIPASFFVPSHLYFDDKKYRKRSPIGPYDCEILCESCDQFINKEFDQYAKVTLIDEKNVLKHQLSNGDPASNVYKLSDSRGYEKILKFFISVYWRASISKKNETFKRFSLGKYESVARRIVLGEDLNSINRLFSVVIFKFNNFTKPIHLLTPKRIKVDGINFYSHLIAYHKIFFKCDQRPVSKKLEPICLTGSGNILMVEDNFYNFPEAKIIASIAKKVGYQEKM